MKYGLDNHPRRAVDIDLRDSNNKVIYQGSVIAPEGWSDNAVRIVASKYLYKVSETDIFAMIERVVRGVERGLLTQRKGLIKSKEERASYLESIAEAIVDQRMAFNSPVWFNVGLFDAYLVEDSIREGELFRFVRSVDEPESRAPQDKLVEDVQSGSYGGGNLYSVVDAAAWPQISACFIQGVEDNMQSIMDIASNEAKIFTYGSGSGLNLSNIRSLDMGTLSNGGQPSGPLSFMQVYDSVAGVVRSGGKCRRAACMRVLDIDHPDILQFIQAKVKEENKVQVLVKAGYSWEDAYGTVQYQNANLSVSVSDKFMEAVLADNDTDGTVELVSRQDPKKKKKVLADSLFNEIAKAAWLCGDPGLQFRDRINEVHTAELFAPIRSSNPCGEFVFLDNSACNLASLNLLKYLKGDENPFFDFDLFEQDICNTIIAQDALINISSYPTREIAYNSALFRPLGLGYTNLGGLIASLGLGYGTQAAGALAGLITAYMTAVALRQSEELCQDRVELSAPCNPSKFVSHFEYDVANLLDEEDWDLDGDSLTGIDAIKRTCAERLSEMLPHISKIELLRNAQVTLLAPTGTIGFMMDCDTTGIEPMLALKSTKYMVDGSTMQITPKCLKRGLRALGADAVLSQEQLEELSNEYREVDEIVGDIKETHPELLQRLKELLRTSLGDVSAGRGLTPDEHIRMMAAVQPFLTGAISKTVNMPESATLKDIQFVYIKAWKLGLKSITVYRNNSKGSQPLQIEKEKKPEPGEKTPVEVKDAKEAYFASRRQMPETRDSLTHKFKIGQHEGYLTVGKYEDGSPGELFVQLSKQGSALQGFIDCAAILFSIALQHGAPLEALTDKLEHTNFPPQGFAKCEGIGRVSSIPDYIAKWLRLTFPDQFKQKLIVEVPKDKPVRERAEAPICAVCGSLMVRAGTCDYCTKCGESSGCS